MVPGPQVRWDKLRDPRDITLERLLPDLFEELYWLQGEDRLWRPWFETRQFSTGLAPQREHRVSNPRSRRRKRRDRFEETQVREEPQTDRRQTYSAALLWHNEPGYPMTCGDGYRTWTCWESGSSARQQLAPTTAGANTLVKCRLMASSSATRKIAGYMFLASLPLERTRHAKHRSSNEATPKVAHTLHPWGLGPPESSVGWDPPPESSSAGEEHREGLGNCPRNTGGQASTSSTLTPTIRIVAAAQDSFLASSTCGRRAST